MIVIILLLLITPLILTILNFYYLFTETITQKSKYKYILVVMVTVVMAIFESGLYITMFDVNLNADASIPIYQGSTHTFLETSSQPYIILLFTIGCIALCVFYFLMPNKTPPLVYVIIMSTSYMSVYVAVLYMIQTISTPLFFVGLNFLLIAFRIYKVVCIRWQRYIITQADRYNYGKYKKIFSVLENSKWWPTLAFVFSIPLLMIYVGILVLFGQSPDILIRGWTQTSDWTLSTIESPPPIEYDQHYLCTVAAGGHPKIVKPIRKGIRHDHEVIVNRQLCVANAFEQILEERVPNIHGYIRRVYDKYGFPIARHIHSPYTADIIYFVMKPLEYIFWIVLYSTDVHPEDRIALQYFPKRYQKKYTI